MLSLRAKTLILTFLLAAGVVAAANPALAWSLKPSPFFSDYTDILRLPSGPILLGTQGGVYVSADEGDTWFFSGLNAHDELDAGDPPRFDAAETADGQVHIVTGRYFHADPDLRGVYRVAGPDNPRSIEANGDTLWVSSWEKIHRSVDAGATWEEVYTVPSNDDDLVSIRRNPQSGALVCQVEKVGGVHLVRSTDGGATWTPQQVSGVYGSVFALEYDPDGTLWLGHNYQNQGVLRTSQDNGQSTQIQYTAPSNRQLGELTLGPAQRMAMTQGSATIVSLDGGATWIQRTTDFAHPAPLFFTGGERLLAGLSDGIQVSEDEGETWVSRNEGLQGNYPFEADVAPDGTAWLLSSSHLWLETADGWLDRGAPTAIVQTPHALRTTSTGRIIVLGYGDAAPRGAYSDDAGATWQTAAGLADVNDYGRFQNIIERDGLLYAGHDGRGLFVSGDDGSTWENRGPEARGSVAIDGVGTLWAGGDLGLRRSLDGGYTWQMITTVDAIGPPVASPVAGTVVVPSWSGRWASTDGGATWINIFDAAWSYLWTVNFAAASAGAAEFTTDGRLVMAVTGNNNNNYRTETRLVESSDDGLTWTDITADSGINHAVIREIVLGTAGFLLATSNQGLWGTSFPDQETAVGDDLPSSIPVLENNRPNPFNPLTVIPFSLPRQALVKLEVVDIRGRRVQTLVDGILPAGLHRVEFNGAELSSGVYLYRLVTPAGTRSGKMSLVK